MWAQRSHCCFSLFPSDGDWEEEVGVPLPGCVSPRLGRLQCSGVLASPLFARVPNSATDFKAACSSLTGVGSGRLALRASLDGNIPHLTLCQPIFLNMAVVLPLADLSQRGWHGWKKSWLWPTLGTALSSRGCLLSFLFSESWIFGPAGKY